jgi:predicted DNA binding CopG/RHH family protein
MSSKDLTIPPKPKADEWVHQSPPKPRAEKMKRLTLDIPEELHRAIKVRAAQEGMSIAQQLRAMLEQQYQESS